MNKNNNKLREKKSLRNVSSTAMQRAVITIVNTTILTVIYFGAMNIEQPILSAIVTAGYWLGFAGFLIAYIVYNRGFTRKDVTREMLPDTWSEEKKTEFIEDTKRRYENSKWMLTVIIPIMIPIALDAIVLFTWPIVQNLLGLK